MTFTRQKNDNVKLLSCLVNDADDDEGDSEYRFLVDGNQVKYVTTAPGSFVEAVVDCTFGPLLLGNLFPTFPSGD